MGIDAIFDAETWSRVPFHFWSMLLFMLGCMVGSFLNVCIYRMPLGLSVVSPPSHCPHCKYSIPWFLNVPLVTWLMLRGRCRNCGAPISVRYFLVELLTGTVFLACWLRFGQVAPWIALVYACFVAGLVAATFIDFEHFIIPDEITLGGMAAGFVVSGLLPGLHGADSMAEGLGKSLLGLGVGWGIVYAILRMGKLLFGRQKLTLPQASRIVFGETALHLPDQEVPYEDLFYRDSDTLIVKAQRVEMVDRCYGECTVRLSKPVLKINDDEFSPDQVPYLEMVSTEMILPREAMGFGDVKFMAAIGAFLGWQAAVFSLMVSSMIGALVGVALILMRRREWSSRLPYGPYIAVAAILWMFGGKEFVQRYLLSGM
ncbi:MAG: prepilin peptidase [Verrucomicrobia bacterium]|jgi:leader peptidase (prepilin peptidase)/N-methyltransferase|nr:prepilin peptidase [Verrucomicrobiota bacterium]